MLTAADEWHVHQTSEPIAVAGTDRNFYDRSYFGAFDLEAGVLVAVAFGIYPHLNVADAHITIVIGGVQHCLHASKTLHSDRATLRVGPVAIEIVQPLHELRVTVDDHDGIAADLTFIGRHFPIEEPRFVYRVGPRTFMDYTRLSQGTTVDGWVSVDGVRTQLGTGATGVRDRSWGIRNTGAPDQQPHQPPVQQQFAWLWTPVHLPGRTIYWHLNADATGRAWNTRAVICPDSASEAEHVHAHGVMTLHLADCTRWVDAGTLKLLADDGEELTLDFAPRHHLEMQGIGYFHPRWAHGLAHGELEVERETLTLAATAPGHSPGWHRQLLCAVTASDGTAGTGILEHLFIGPYAPLGLIGDGVAAAPKW